MTIQYHTLTNEQYKDQRYNVLVWLEESGVVKTTLYRDSKGFPTIGAGFKVTSNWKEIFMAFGINWEALPGTTEYSYVQKIKAKFYTDTAMTKEKTFTTAEIATLQTELNAIMAQRAADPEVTAIDGQSKRATFTFNDENEIKATFQIIADEREKTLNKWLATKGLTVPDSNERVTLLSLVYNNIIGFKDSAQTILKSSKLLDALAAGNRAEAWYEIRYNSNGDKSNGIAKRRYYEADYFDLYNAEPQTAAEKETESKTILRMYTLHKPQIDAYDQEYGAQVAQANNDYKVTWVKTLTANLQSAKDLLITNFAQGRTIDGEIIVGKGLTTYEYKDKGNYKDSISGTANNDLIFGERGDDTVVAGSGDDVVYGGEGNDFIAGEIGGDTLYGEAGNDVLIGGGGDDYLGGEKGDDVLIGGSGFDTYYYTAGDGFDQISDTGENRIIIEDANGKVEVINTVYKTGDNVWTTPDGEAQATKNSPLKITFKDGGSIQLTGDFQDGDLGIHLQDVPENPTTTHEIVEDNWSHEPFLGGIIDTASKPIISCIKPLKTCNI